MARIETHIASYSFLDVHELVITQKGRRSMTAFKASFAGNMTNDMSDVQRCFEALFGAQAWVAARDTSYLEIGSPGYMWEMCFTADPRKASTLSLEDR